MNNSLLSTALLATVLSSMLALAASAQEMTYNYKPSPLNNPVRGLVPYAAAMPWFDTNWTAEEAANYRREFYKNVFPHSVEFHYFSMRELMPAEGEVNFAPIEKWLTQTTSRGCQLTFRVFLEYPNRDVSVPQFLIDEGLKMTTWRNNDGETIHAPDYDNPRLRAAIDLLISKLGEKYDGDPRVACLTMGILGHWGEWHSYPKSELFPKKKYQSHVMDQFAAAFKTTPVLMRYPAGEDDWSYAPNSDRSFGFHDDSFAWATIDTGKQEDDWYFLAKMKNAEASDAWKTRMIGGEIRPEIWGCVFNDQGCEPKGQEFDRCVRESHVTWLMDSGMFGNNGKPPTAEQIRNATKRVGKMGYEFHIPRAKIEITKQGTHIEIELENRGVAPFYFDWPVEVAVLEADGKIVTSNQESWNLPSLKGAGDSLTKAITFPVKIQGNQSIAIRIKNPMPGGDSIRFANEKQRLDSAGWMMLR